MKTAYCQQVKWDGQCIQIELSSLDKENYLSMQLSLWERKSKQIKLIEYTLDDREDSLYCEINTDQLRNIKMGQWDFYIKFKLKRHWRRLSLRNQVSLLQQTRYFEPIKTINSTRSFSLYLTSQHALSIHCARADILEGKTYNVVSYNEAVVTVEESEESFILRLNGASHWPDYAELIVKNEYNEIYHLALNYQSGNIFLYKHHFEQLKGQWTFYIQTKKGRILEQAHLYLMKGRFINDESLLKTTQYEYYTLNESSTLKIQLREYNQPAHVIKGELTAEHLTVQGHNMMFEIPASKHANYENWSFFLKRKNSEERLYLNTHITTYANKIQLSIDIEQFQLISSKSTAWGLFAENKHDDYMEVRKVGQYHSSLPSIKNRYIGFFEMGDGLCAVPTITKSSSYSLYFMTVDQFYKLTSPAEVSIKSLTMKSGVMKLRLLVGLANQTPFEFNGLKLIQRKGTAQQIELPIERLRTFKNGRKEITSTIDLAQLEFEPFYWDFFASITMSTNEHRQIRIYSDNYLVIKKLRHFMFKYTMLDHNQYLTYPYLTVNGGLSITHRKKGEDEDRKNKVIEYAAYIYYHMIYKYITKEPIWLIHEKYSETAQDNSYYFFKYCYDQHKEKKVYYVIKKGTKDEFNLKGYEDRVVYFMSFKHLVRLLSAKMIISSEAKGHGYAWRVSQGVIKDYVNAKKYVFLQHGVLGLKKVDNTFDYNTQNSAELFVASSDYEKRIIKKYFGYKDNRIIVTGLPRWDVLQDRSNQMDINSKEILLMPTWRNWLEEVEEAEFIQSDYFHAYNNLLHSDALHEVLRENSLILNFYVHPKFMPYVSSFTKANNNINIIQFGEVKVNDLLMRSSLLITDYSSVSWEMHYQKKPVLFYHFDVDQYNKFQGSYMDLKKELFGEAVYDSQLLIKSIGDLARAGFVEQDKYARKRSEFFKYVDSKNSERIYHEVVLKEKEISTKLNIFRSIRQSDLMKVLWRRYKNIYIIQRFGKKILSVLR
ncbi:CDP-glycerol glycerophosphotransferase family protein [Alkalicoccobacillus murimartini]|uniref:CDP-glycerol glycerophosphotransferase (TagB/SpsB family) n=1 Tax=Alkalicoccobacillus murimartini TaxID=171685 RepID=A0ABT9YH35_9BACI|nr:CDP-glycerol glycerophosphotransferase family protein [Alkalicoccobacillus murimartini]MDQ0206805.1 CDP-glycerol glycerophosphotransferase (TagB/SpsB family) [Alkalicoccobacillus murimartini]